MDSRIIKSPSSGIMDILKSRISVQTDETVDYAHAVGLVQGKLIDMICAADVAEKLSDVTVCDVRGSCPQNMILLAIFGDIASVEAAIEKIREENALHRL